MSRFQKLGDLKRREAREVPLAALPEVITMTGFARAKAFAVNRLVRRIHGGSFEWYGFTLGSVENPECIIDIGLPKNDQNLQQYANIGSEGLAAFQETLPRGRLVNGWIHSHGDLNFQHFSETDAANQQVVLDFVATRLKIPVAKRELVIRDLALLAEGQDTAEHLRPGSVSLVTDRPVGRAALFEAVYGCFCYAIVIDDSGWQRQEIHYKRRGILSGQTATSRREAEVALVEPDGELSPADLAALEGEVKEKIQPSRYVLAKLEGM